MSDNMTTPHLPGKFIWFEHVSGDTAKARAFYEPLFGWHIEAMTMGGSSYSMILNGSGGIGGFVDAPAGKAAHWLSHLSVPDVDKSFAAATKAGAKPLMAPTDFPPVGRGATITDPTGAELSLWRSANGDRPDVADVAMGDWVWNELWTPDSARAVAFYESVFGYTHEAMNMGEQGTYLILKDAGGTSRAGIFDSTNTKAPPMWLPYVRVADCDASAAKAGSLGANVFMPPTDIPGVGRLATMFDPLGAALAVFVPKPAAK